MPPDKPKQDHRPVSLKVLSEYLDLSPATISVVLNNAPRAKSISAAARARIFAAAKMLDYRPNTIARSLRMKQTLTVGVIAPDLGEGYFPEVMSGVEQSLTDAGYIYFVLCHQHRKDLMEEYPRLLVKRAVDGLLLLNSTLVEPVNQPVVSISGDEKTPGVTSIVLDHDRAARLALKHLQDLGHRRIAFMIGRPEIQDSERRWQSLQRTAGKMGITVFPELCVQLEHNKYPELGSPVIRDLLARTRDFTAILCFNDLAAIGAIRALADASLSCPGDVSVIGFDDIPLAAFQVPSLTTIRQPLRQMGETAAQLLLKRIQKPHDEYQQVVTFAPELIIRESTGPVRLKTVSRRKPRQTP